MKVIERTIDINNSSLEAYISLEIDGVIVKEFKANSLLAAFIKMLYVCMCGDNTVFTNDTATPPVSRRLGQHSSNFNIAAPANTDTYGIVVGTGTAAVTTDDSKLQTQILHGSTSGRLSYAAMSVASPSIGVGTGILRSARVFANSSGSAITVNEVGLITRTYADRSTLTYRNFLLLRDLIPGGVVVPNGKSLTVNIDIKTTLTSSGGFVRQFHDLLKRMFTGTNDSAIDITNTARTVSNSPFTFYCALGGGNAEVKPAMSVSPFETNMGQNIGIMIGTSGTAVAMSNFFLGGKITHGQAAGKVTHYGTLVDKLDVNTGANYAEFEISRIFSVDTTPNDILVREIGIGVLDDISTTTMSTYLILRDLVEISISYGDWLLVKYKIRAVA